MENKIILKVLNSDYLFEVAKDFEKEIIFEGVLTTITIPEGFYTDMASVPKALWFWIAPFGKHQEAALIHDYLYANSGLLLGLERKLTRKESDQLFYEIMKKDGTNKVKAKIMKWSVNLFGWLFWEKTETI